MQAVADLSVSARRAPAPPPARCSGTPVEAPADRCAVAASLSVEAGNRGGPVARGRGTTRRPSSASDSDGNRHSTSPAPQWLTTRRQQPSTADSRHAGRQHSVAHASSRLLAVVQQQPASESRRQTAAACPSWSGPDGRAQDSARINGAHRSDRCFAARSTNQQAVAESPAIAAAICTARRRLPTPPDRSAFRSRFLDQDLPHVVHFGPRAHETSERHRKMRGRTTVSRARKRREVLGRSGWHSCTTRYRRGRSAVMRT